MADRKPQIVTTPPIYVSKETAAAAMALSVSTFERGVAQGLYPKPRRLSNSRVGWLWTELLAAAETLPVSDLLPPPNTGAPKPRRPRVPEAG